jgi:hypothetical protein
MNEPALEQRVKQMPPIMPARLPALIVVSCCDPILRSTTPAKEDLSKERRPPPSPAVSSLGAKAEPVIEGTTEEPTVKEKPIADEKRPMEEEPIVEEEWPVEEERAAEKGRVVEPDEAAAPPTSAAPAPVCQHKRRRAGSRDRGVTC